MEPLIWIFLPVFVAAGSALLSFYVMQARMEVAIAREREILAQARATISAQEKILEEKIRATEEQTRREAFNDFLNDFRVEERHYVRESKSLFLNRKSMVLQERLFFRNIPLSNWVEHELTVEDNGGDLNTLAKACSIFSTQAIADGQGSTKMIAEAQA